MKTDIVLALLVVVGSTLSAQTVPPALMVQEEGRSRPLGLAKVQTEVRIFGSVAETTTTMTFTNSLPRVMEGNLYFPLPEGATIGGYALDINGVMVDGVAVEKHEARRVFEEVVRQGIDPGLVEWTKGNSFQARVFPIPAGGSRTVRLQYVTELVGDKDSPAYHLPLKYKEPLQEFVLRVEVVKPTASPSVRKGELANFAFEKWRDSYVAETKQQNWLPVEDLLIALPKTDQPQIVVEKAEDGQVYFAVHEYPPASETQRSPVSGARHAVVCWDASGSRAGDHQREIAVLQGYLGQLLADRAEGEGSSIRIDIVLLRNALSKPVQVEYSKSKPGALVAVLQNVPYDGGTQLGAIGPLSGAGKPDLYLLFTDGISTFGSEEPAPLDAPLFILSTAASANHAFLHSLALSNGGQYYNLANWKDADVVAQAGRSVRSFLSATIDGGNTKDLYPQRTEPLAGRFTVVGKLTADTATVTVNYGIRGRASEPRTFKVSRADAVAGSLLRRLWSQRKLAELMIHQKRNEKEIAALGKQFGMVTPYTSLLVLDSLEQYVRYEIAPPPSLAAMREEYLRRVDTLEHQKQKEKGDKQTAVVRMWEERVRWWNTEFKYPKDFHYAGEGKPDTRVERDTQGRIGGGGLPSMLGGAARKEMADRNGAAREPLSPAAPRPSLESRSIETPQGRPSEMAEAGAAAPSPTAAPSPVPDREPGIVIQAWNPDTPYLKELQAGKGKADLFAVYMKNRAQYGSAPAFFLDCAAFFRDASQVDLALQVLSNIAELEMEDAALLRVLGYRLLEIGQLDLAVQTLEQVLDLRPEEPQSYRDLALSLARRAEEASRAGSRTPDAIRQDYTRALDLFVHLVLAHWDDRFPQIEILALEELNRILPKAKSAGVSAVQLDPRLIKLLDVDVRIVMTWHADNTDIDLWVTEPSKEKAMYSHNRTTIGGLVSADFTQGYGPEEYLLRRAAHGMYKIEANYYGSRATRLLGAVTVQVDVFTNYGRENEQRKSLMLRLKEAKETFVVGEIEF